MIIDTDDGLNPPDIGQALNILPQPLYGCHDPCKQDLPLNNTSNLASGHCDFSFNVETICLNICVDFTQHAISIVIQGLSTWELLLLAFVLLDGLNLGYS